MVVLLSFAPARGAPAAGPRVDLDPECRAQPHGKGNGGHFLLSAITGALTATGGGCR
jgi:hypothetical protein